MTVRTRLYLILGALFLVPILVGALILAFVVPTIHNDRVRDSVASASAAMRSELAAECTQLGLASQVLALSSQAVGIDAAGTQAGSAVTARVLTPGLMRELVRRTGRASAVVLLKDGRVVASSDTIAVASRVTGLGTAPITVFLVILLAGAVLAGVLVTSVARSLSQPFADLTEMAERVARGDLDAQLQTVGEGEAGRLGEAFNRMTHELRKNMSALEQSREEDLRDSLERIGDTLSNTHDLEGLLQVVLETAVATLRADAGVVLFGAPDQVRVVAEHGLHHAGLAAPTGVTTGAGVLGRVLATGESARGQLGTTGLMPAPTEPATGQVLATPLRSMGAVTGVFALYGRDGGFDALDDDALRTLSGQASTAIDNVQLHQEAQRLSTTDGLTGLWNFRYLSMSLGREVERSTRFERPLAVLMLDLDHFKAVNDTYGHARGDSVLRELAHRVQEQIREVDTFARYGGEEFVVVLPETTIEGAVQLAERICLGVRRAPFQVDGEEPLKVTVSIGVAAFPRHGSSAATLMRAADKALYVVKHEGRDGWHQAD